MSSHWIEDMYHIIKSVRVKRMGPMGLKQCLVVFYCLLSERQKTNKNLRSLSGELPCPGPAEEVELCQVDISLITFFVGTNFILIILIFLSCHLYSTIIVSSSYWEQEYTMPSTQECKLNFNPLHGAVSTFKRRRPPWSTLLSVHHRWECIAPALFWRTARIIILGLKCARRITQSAWSSPQLRPHPHSKCSWWWDLESNPGWSLSGLDPLDWVEFLQSDLWGRITASGTIWNFILDDPQATSIWERCASVRLVEATTIATAIIERNAPAMKTRSMWRAWNQWWHSYWLKRKEGWNMTNKIITSVPLVDPLDTLERVLGILWRRLVASYFIFLLQINQQR